MHVLRRGVIARLDEPGRGSLLRSLASTIFFRDDDGSTQKTRGSKHKRHRGYGDEGHRARPRRGDSRRRRHRGRALRRRLSRDGFRRMSRRSRRLRGAAGVIRRPAAPPACCADPSKKYPPTRARRGPWTPPPSPPSRAARRRRRRSSPRGTSFRWAFPAACSGTPPRLRLRWSAAWSSASPRRRVRVEGPGVPRRRGLPARALRASRGAVASRRDSRFVEKGVGREGAPDASGDASGKRRERIEREKVVGHIGFMSSVSAKKKRRPGGPRWPPARELRWRAAAVDLLAAYAFVARTDDDESNDESDEGAMVRRRGVTRRRGAVFPRQHRVFLRDGPARRGRRG